MIPVASAYSENITEYPEFSIYGVKSNHIFVNSSDDIRKTYSFRIINEDSDVLNFTIIINESFDGSSEWIKLIDSKGNINDTLYVSISPHETYSANYMISVPKNTKIGNYSSEFLVCTNGYHSKVSIHTEIKDNIGTIEVFSEGIEFLYIKLNENPYIFIGILVIVSIAYLRRINFHIAN